jgi:hypothetical protein
VRAFTVRTTTQRFTSPGPRQRGSVLDQVEAQDPHVEVGCLVVVIDDDGEEVHVHGPETR